MHIAIYRTHILYRFQYLYFEYIAIKHTFLLVIAFQISKIIKNKNITNINHTPLTNF